MSLYTCSNSMTSSCMIYGWTLLSSGVFFFVLHVHFFQVTTRELVPLPSTLKLPSLYLLRLSLWPRVLPMVLSACGI